MQIARQTSSSENPSPYCLLAAEKSENSEYNILQSMNFLLQLRVTMQQMCLPRSSKNSYITSHFTTSINQLALQTISNNYILSYKKVDCKPTVHSYITFSISHLSRASNKIKHVNYVYFII
jgi:hypothetical protein